MTIAQPWRKPATLLGAAIIASSGIITAAAPRHVAHAAPAIPSGGTVIAAEADTPDALNPYLNQQLSTVDIDSAIFDGLVKVGDTGQFLPDLAERWTSSANQTRWTFYLNPKATWQDGQPVTAKDVVFTANLVKNPLFPATSTLGFDHIKTIKAVGNTEVDITLTQPYAPFLLNYAANNVLPQHILGSVAVAKIRTDASYNRMPLGSGPFKVTEFAAGDHITLVANKSYFLGAPHLAQLIFRIVPNSATVLNQLRTGEVTLAGQTADLSARQLNQLKHVSGLTTHSTPGFNWQHIDLLETGFLKDVKVRQALQMATPRERVIKDVALGYGVPQYSDQAPTKSVYTKAVESYWPYNPTKAVAMLTADGFKKGSGGILQKGGVPFNLTLYGDAASAAQLQINEIAKAAWTGIGINVTARSLDPATLFGQRGPLYDPARLSSSSMKAVQYEWIEGADPDDQFFWSSSKIIGPNVHAGGNFDGYSNPTVDKLIEQGLTTTDTASRKAIYQQIQVILARDVPDIWLYWANVLTVSTSKLHNYDPNPFNYRTAWNAKDWYLQ
jgi:peptide/nickel transport system substrate-binding protein